LVSPVGIRSMTCSISSAMSIASSTSSGAICRHAQTSFQVQTTEDGWRVDVPLPGVDPKDVSLEVAGNNLTIRAEVPSEGGDKSLSRYEQTLIIPQFLDLEKLTASHRHGMLRLTLPLKESVKPRRVQIETQVEDQKQLTGVR
jgi:HSP20 family protein